MRFRLFNRTRSRTNPAYLRYDRLLDQPAEWIVPRLANYTIASFSE